METIKLLGGATVYLYEAKAVKCKFCGMKIYWATTKKAKSMPICKDDKGNWVSHFSNCEYKEAKEAGDGDSLDEISVQKKRNNRRI